MTFPRLLGLLVPLLPLLLAYLVWIRVGRLGRGSRRLTALMVAFGGVAGGLATFFEQWVLGVTGLSFEVRQGGAGGALLATFLLAAPLEEAVKVLVVWPLYRTRRLSTPRLGICYGSAAGAGVACAEALYRAFAYPASAAGLLRSVFDVPGQLFFAGIWGYALGEGRRRRGRFFSLAWLAATLLHGLYDHIVWGRGAGYVATVVPLIGFMAVGAWVALGDVAPETFSSGRFALPEPPSIEQMRAALKPVHEGLMLVWVVAGALVTFGTILAAAAGAVYLGSRLGVDFSRLDESDLRSSGPIILLGSAVLLAFPIAGYLVARASAARSMLEPALGAGLTVLGLVALLAVTVPVGVLFALAIAPLALGLCCAGAWMGLER